jgi:hypothetical protein
MIVVFVIIVMFLAGCGAAAPTPSTRVAVMVDAPPYQAASVPITLENAAQLRYLGRLDQPDVVATVFAYSVSPDGLNVVGLTEQEIIAWDLLTGARAFVTARGDAERAVYASDKEAIYLVDSTGSLRSMDAASGEDRFQALGHPTFIGVSAFAPDADLVALAGSDGTIKVWDMLTRDSRITINAADVAITALTFSPDALRVFSADADGWRRVWDSMTGALIREQRDAVLGTTQLVSTVLSLSPDGEVAAAANESGALLWMPDATGQTLPLSSVYGRPSLLRWSSDSRWLVTGTARGGVSLWDVLDGRLVGALPDTAGSRISADFSPDAPLLVTTALDGTTHLWDVSAASGTGLRTSILNVGSRTIFAVEWTDDGRSLLFFDANGAIYVWGI